MAGRAGGSPTFSPQRLERPDDRLHARRPSDESEQIIRMSNMLHLPNKPLPIPSPSPFTFYMPDSRFNDYGDPGMSRMSPAVMGLSDTGRSVAFSDSYLHSDMDDGPPYGGNESSPWQGGGGISRGLLPREPAAAFPSPVDERPAPLRSSAGLHTQLPAGQDREHGEHGRHGDGAAATTQLLHARLPATGPPGPTDQHLQS
eukprot:Em0006g873a